VIVNHVYLNKSWLIPSLTMALFGFPLSTARCSSFIVMGASNMSIASCGGLLFVSSQVPELSSFTGIVSYFLRMKSVNVSIMFIAVVWVAPLQSCILCTIRASCRIRALMTYYRDGSSPCSMSCSSLSRNICCCSKWCR